MPWFNFRTSSAPTTTTAAPFPKPEFCGKYECPEYETEQLRGYELRTYRPSVWASAKVPSLDMEYWENGDDSIVAYMKLFNYIRGANDRNITVARTVPVVYSHEKDEVWMNFMIPANMSDNPPQPTDTDVQIYRADSDQYYVRYNKKAC
ncbi:hypothetical protein EB796_010044 [Bugula neritina]|uniref:HEBP2 n=1 Tax=Bugula neritina TaxID=10212 RepID=A0A7J7JZ17_BUGNE|nr:hypothetical protein EB796_010044 [Bugula neritina]